MHFYKRHITEYTAKTAHLTLLEHGVLIRLIDLYMQTERPIKDSDKYRMIGARSKPEQEAVNTILGEFFKLVAGNWVNEKLDGDLHKYHTRAVTNKTNGKQGGRPPKVVPIK